MELHGGGGGGGGGGGDDRCQGGGEDPQPDCDTSPYAYVGLLKYRFMFHAPAPVFSGSEQGTQVFPVH